MRLVLLGGAPGVGKTSAAEKLLLLAAAGDVWVQWVDVDALWRHQPWRVDSVTKRLLQDNLRAVLGHAATAGIDIVVVTWVFQDSSFHDLVIGLAPPNVQVTTVQLLIDETAWRTRFGADDRPPIDEFFRDRYRAAQQTPADHRIDVSTLDATATATAVADAIGLTGRSAAQ
jgi:hypothetical protein